MLAVRPLVYHILLYGLGFVYISGDWLKPPSSLCEDVRPQVGYISYINLIHCTVTTTSVPDINSQICDCQLWVCYQNPTAVLMFIKDIVPNPCEYRMYL